MDEPTDILIPLLPPFLALLGQAIDAQARGERAAHDLWLAAAAHLHAVEPDALAQLTGALIARQRTADAVALAECAARMQPGATAYFNHGYALQMAGRHADAVAPYRAALALDAERPSLRNNLAIALRLSGSDRAEEIALLEAAVQADPRDVQAWINLVVARLATHDLDGALACGARLVELAPDNALAMNNVALAMKEAQRWDDAERYAVRACELAPDDASYRFNLAIIQLVRGNFAAGWRGHEAR
ncbi:TPA: tetratricopeptide repeat protein, partial [Burkholderia aenigmatica]|nr:tetratricopeptide repeat protein [Burkholderia aenigmatica]